MDEEFLGKGTSRIGSSLSDRISKTRKDPSCRFYQDFTAWGGRVSSILGSLLG